MMDRKKLIETIQDPMITGIFDKLGSTGLFEFINETNKHDLDVDYYLSHSGNKMISNLYNNMDKLYPDQDILSKLSTIIINRYKDKWIRIFEALIMGEYDPIENYKMIEVETPDLNTHRITKTDQDVTNTSDLSEYGFNSQSPVPVNGNVTRLQGSGDNNKVDEDINTSGTRTLTRSGNIGVTTSQQMLESEIKLRSTYNMISIIFDDVDKVLCLPIY